MNEAFGPEELLRWLRDTMSAVFENRDNGQGLVTISQKVSEDGVVLLEACHNSKNLSVVLDTGTYHKSNGELAVLRKSFGLSIYSYQIRRIVLNFIDTSFRLLKKGNLQDKLEMMRWIIEEQVGPCDKCGAMMVPSHGFKGNRICSQYASLNCFACGYVVKITPHEINGSYLNDYLKKKR